MTREKSSIKCLGEMKKILQFLTLFTIFKRLTTFGAKNGLNTIIKYSANVLAHFYDVISTSSASCIEKIYSLIDFRNRKSK